MAVTPFRFGAGAFSATSGAQWADRARQIEDLGYATLIIGDHIGSGMFGPFSALAAAAAATTTLHVGTTTFANDFRHPAVLAKEAATLDLLSDGRFELGLGAGWAKRQYDLAGFAFDPAGTRVSRLSEAVQIIHRLWSGEAVVFAGQHYHLDGLQLNPRPSRPLQLFIGGSGRRVLSLAGQYASTAGVLERATPDGSGYDSGSETLEMMATKAGWVRNAAAGRDGEVELALLIRKVVVTDDREGAATMLASERAITPSQALGSPLFLLGTLDEITAQLETLRARSGISYVSVFPGDVEPFASVVARLAGR
jgi:probable F420-dependent oxidoreductase